MASLAVKCPGKKEYGLRACEIIVNDAAPREWSLENNNTPGLLKQTCRPVPSIRVPDPGDSRVNLCRFSGFEGCEKIIVKLVAPFPGRLRISK